MIEIASQSGSVLRGWWLAAAQPGRGSVVLLHGVWESRRRMVPRAVFLHGQGFGVLLIDLQAHGESTGRRITFGKLESLDAATAVSFVRMRAPAERVGVIGVSLGGAATLLGPDPLDVAAIVLESVYPDINAALANRLRAGLGPTAGPVLTPVLSPLFTWLLPPVLGVAPAELRPIERIQAVRAPLLVLSGVQDDRTTIAESRALFARAPEPKQFLAVAGAAHVDLEQHDPGGYWRVVLPFLEEHLSAP
ncbi:alpha/beta hydrolase [Roseomonas sp. AR75]|uniref:alpha/beta hydrolase n=1 Tax=Roseomonas sp. AR75 TaxID=2562311 RepID=UPI0014852F15|nr:alpha/beta fold hydrolase [Roseomonas sp. AR75]